MRTQPLLRPPQHLAKNERPLRVCVMDLLSIVPYYTGHLASALQRRKDIRLRLGAITYHLDRTYFSRENLKLHPGLNLVSKLPSRPSALRRCLKLIEYLFNLAASLARFSLSRPDILHVQFLPMLAMGVPVELWFLRIVRRMGIPTVYTVHNLLPQDNGERRRSLYQAVYTLPAALICHDHAVQQRLTTGFGIPLSRIHVIPHGPLFVPSARIYPDHARRKLAIPDGHVLVLWQGILRPYKGVPFLLKAWQQVQAACPHACLAVLGTGDSALTHEIANEVAALGISGSVRIELRFVTGDEMALFYEAADILVYPYREITTSGALMTGIGYGKAIVTTRLAAFESVLTHGRNALMVPYGDVDNLAQTLQALIEQPAIRQKLGAAAKETQLQSQGWPEIAARTAAVYQSLLGR